MLPFSFSITRQGILYILCLFVISLVAINTANNLLFIIVATLLAAIAVSGIVSRNCLKHIHLSLQLPENVFLGEKVPIKITIKNVKKIFPSMSVRVESLDSRKTGVISSLFGRFSLFHRGQTAASQKSDRADFRQCAYFPILRAGEARSEMTVQSFPRRGLYRLKGFQISTCYPFGLFFRGERIGVDGEVLVYPHVKEISAFFHLLPFLPGLVESMNIGPGENLFSLRKYQEGESARIIDWKATAKTSELMAREFAREDECRFCLILDTFLHNQGAARNEADFEKAVSLAASLAAHFMEAGAGIDFLTPREYVTRGAGRDHLYVILKSLALVQPETAPPELSSCMWDARNFPGIRDAQILQRIVSDKVFKIIITSQPRGSFPSAVWRSSHVVFFDEL